MDLDAIKSRIAKASTIPDSGITPRQIVGWWAGQKDPVTFPKDEYYHPAKNVSNELNLIFAGLRTCVLGLVADGQLLVSEVEYLHDVITQKDSHITAYAREQVDVRELLKLPLDKRITEGVRLVVESRDNAKRERNSLLEDRDELQSREWEVRKTLGIPTGSSHVESIRLVRAIADERAELAKLLGINLPEIGALPSAALAAVDAIRAELHAAQQAALAEGVRNAELDELRTRYARLTESTDTFVAALVDERMKREHKALLDEIDTHRKRDTDASKHIQLVVLSMPDKARAVFEHARIDARIRGVPIVRELADMVVNVRATASIECDRLRAECRRLESEIEASRNECRTHLARINELDSQGAGLVESLREMVESNKTLESERDSLRTRLKLAESRLVDPSKAGKLERIAADVFDDNHAVPDDVLHQAIGYANSETSSTPHSLDMRYAKNAIAGAGPGHKWYDCVRGYVAKWHKNSACMSEALAANDGAVPIGVGEIGAIVESTSARNDTNISDDVLMRAARFANKKTGLVPGPHDLMFAKESVAEPQRRNEWCDALREFVKLWRDGRAPDEPTTMTAWPDKP